VPAVQRGQVYKLGGGSWAYRCRDASGQRRQVGGFRTKGDARDALDAALVLAQGGPRAAERRAWTLAQLVDAYLAQHQVSDHRKTTLRWLLRKATDVFGDMLVRDLLPEELGRWAASIPEGHRFEATQALKQVLRAAVAWDVLDRDLASGMKNPQPRRAEVQPFASWDEVEAVAVELGPWGPLVTFAAATGLRPEELLGLERRDVDRRDGVVHVRRVFVRGRVKHEGKTPGSVPRRVPLSDRALSALDAVVPRLDSPLIFPATRGGHLDLHNWRAREWLPAVRAAGFVDAAGKPTKRIYDLRHTFTTFAIHALVPSFIIARVMGTSEAMLRKHYGHLLPDTDDLVRERLNVYDGTEGRTREEQIP